MTAMIRVGNFALGASPRHFDFSLPNGGKFVLWGFAANCRRLEAKITGYVIPVKMGG